MLPRRRLRLAASGGVFLALAGVWLGHTVEYVRVAGTAGLREELLGSIHWYMLPVGLALALVAAVLSVRAWQLWVGLGRQLTVARWAIARAWRGGRHTPTESAMWAPRVEQAPRLNATRIWPLLALAQIGLYLLQENLEALAAGVPAPGMQALAGRHWAAPLVHAAVALLLTGAVVLVRRAFQHRSRVVTSTRALLRVLLAVIGRATAARPATPPPAPRPADRFGRLWCRPPPPLLVPC
jgi:hypothetical protein